MKFYLKQEQEDIFYFKMIETHAFNNTNRVWRRGEAAPVSTLLKFAAGKKIKMSRYFKTKGSHCKY